MDEVLVTYKDKRLIIAKHTIDVINEFYNNNQGFSLYHLDEKLYIETKRNFNNSFPNLINNSIINYKGEKTISFRSPNNEGIFEWDENNLNYLKDKQFIDKPIGIQIYTTESLNHLLILYKKGSNKIKMK